MREFLFVGGILMMNLFKKDIDLCAPVAGVCQDMINCKDNVFASKTLGDGVMIIPSENTIKAPCNGKISSLFPTKHAIGIITKDKKEILIHIGIDTVNLNGEHFQSYVSVGDKIKKGEKLITFDQQYMEKNDIDMSTIIILLNGDKLRYKKRLLNGNIIAGDKIIEFESGD